MLDNRNKHLRMNICVDIAAVLRGLCFVDFENDNSTVEPSTPPSTSSLVKGKKTYDCSLDLFF